MAKEDNQLTILPCCDETDSHRKRKRSPQLNKNKKKKAITDSSKQLVIVQEDDSDYVPIEEPKSSSFKRLWSENDEITLLKALKEQKNRSNMTELFNSVKTSLEANVSKHQTSDKVRKLKNKFKNNTVDLAHLEGHKAKVHKLCQQLWGGDDKQYAADDDDADEDDADDDDAAAAVDDDDLDDDDSRRRSNWRRSEKQFWAKYPRMNLRLQNLYPVGNLTEEGYCMIMRLLMKYTSKEELMVMEQKWVDHYIEEIHVTTTKRMQLMEEQMELIQKARQAHLSDPIN